MSTVDIRAGRSPIDRTIGSVLARTALPRLRTVVTTVTSSMLTRIRGRHLFLIDLAVIGMAIIGAFVLRFESFRFREEALVVLPGGLVSRCSCVRRSTPRTVCTRARGPTRAFGELARITAAAVTGTVLGIAVFYGILVPLDVQGTVTDGGNFPRSFFPLEGLLTLAGLGASRFLIRASSEWRGLPGANRGSLARRGSRSGPDADLRGRRGWGAGPAHHRARRGRARDARRRLHRR